jgi:outer membrane receptor protein involved in Fe transport
MKPVHLFRFASIAVFGSMLGLRLANAQVAASAQSEDPISLSVFEVTTSRDIGYQSTHAAEATRMNTPIENIPMNVSIYNQEFIEDLAATATSDLLAYEASAVKTSENDGFLSRGFASVSSNFLNGFGQTGGFGSQPLSNIERVEVLRGPAAVLYGAGGIGGVFNRITKRPKAEPFAHARVILENHGSYRSEFDFNRPLGKLAGRALQFRLTGTHERGETWFGQRRDEDAIAPSLLWNVSRDTQVILEYFFQHHVKQASWETPVHAGNPHGLTTGDGVFRRIPRQIAWISPEDYRDNKRHVASFDVRHSFTPNLQYRSQFQFESKKQDIRETFAESQSITILRDTALMPRRWRHLPNVTDNYRTRNELVWSGATGPVKHRLLVGHSWDEQYVDNADWRSPGNYGGLTGAALTGDGVLANNRIGNDFNSFPNLTYAQFLADPTLAGFNVRNMLPLNLFNRSAEPPVPERGRPALYLNDANYTYTTQQAGYINDVFSLADERVFVMAGFRYQDFERRTINWRQGTFPAAVLLTSAPTVRVHDSQTTSSFGAVWHILPGRQLSLYANQNNTFEAQFRTQPDGSGLDPTTGEQTEVGLRFNLLDGRVSGLVSWFDILQDGVVLNDPVRVGYFIQVNGQRSTGLELSLNARVTDRWYVIGGYSNTDARDDRSGAPQFLQPKHRFTMFNRYRFSDGRLKGLTLSLGSIYTGERPLQPTTVRGSPNWGPLPDYWKLDAIASYRFKVGARRASYDLTFKVNNVLDEQDIYFVAQNHRFTVDPGRVWQVIVGVRF